MIPWIIAALAPAAISALTIYTSVPGSIPTQFLDANGQYTGLAAFDPAQQTAPAAPTPAIQTAVPLALPTGAVTGLSKTHRSDFVGLSLELSVTPNIIGRNGTFLNPIFLNHIQNLHARAGRVPIRIGGNSQEKASIAPAWGDFVGATINKTVDPIALAQGFKTPLLTFTEDLLYAMNNISQLVDVGWYFGVPYLNEPQIAPVLNAATSILGPNLEGIQLGNEPDTYLGHGNRPAPYDVAQYIPEWERVRSTYLSGRTDLIGPSVCCSWTLDEVFAAGYLDLYAQHLKYLSFIHYKDNNCPANLQRPTSQAVYETYLTHQSAIDFFLPYRAAANLVNSKGKELILLETNTASCGGFPGASDSYAAALYLLDIGLQAASIGVSQVLYHNGGVGQFYNLFTPPPGNMSSFRQWTTTSPYYSALILSEVMSTEGSQVQDLGLNGGNVNTPGYAIYKDGLPTRVALFNSITDPSGANDLTVALSVGAGNTNTPAQVTVKYFNTPGNSADKFNLTWAGQTMGDQFGSDGRLQGVEVVETVTCTGGVCNIKVKAPQFALVNLNGQNTINNPALATLTFATSIQTRRVGTVVVPPGVLATSNGRGGAQELLNLGGTSRDQKPHANSAVQAVVGTVFLGLMSGLAMVYLGQ